MTNSKKLTQSRASIKNIQITKHRRPLTAKNYTYELASEHEIEVKRTKPRPEFSHPAARENDEIIRKSTAPKMEQSNPRPKTRKLFVKLIDVMKYPTVPVSMPTARESGEIIRKATALKMKQSNPGPKTRKLFVKLIDVMKYPTVPVSVPVPTRKQTLSTNINKATPAAALLKKAVNVREERPIFIDLTVDENATLMTNNGQSRGVAQIKTKEKAEQCRDEGTAKKQTKAAFKKRKKAVDKSFTETSESETSEDVSGQDPSDSEQDPWRTVPVESDVKSEESDHELEFFESDHEFSTESDDETQIVPTKRARTAHNEDENKFEGKWCACQKCKMYNRPESILLCDKCDLGYHCFCLVSMLFTIPEGDWFCPQCQQEKLIKSLENLMKNLDKRLIRHRALQAAKFFDEIKRRKRKEFASLNMLPDEDETVRKKSKRKSATTGRYLRSNVARDRSNGSSCSDNNKRLYRLRERGQTNVNYRFTDYDDLIKSTASDAKGSDTKPEGKTKGASDSVPKPTRKTKKRELGKKTRKLTSLDTETEDDESDDDFRDTSCSEDEQDDNFSAGSGNDSDN